MKLKPASEKDQVDEQDPVAFDGDLSLSEEGLGDIATTCARAATGFVALLIDLGLWQEETPGNDEDRRAGAEPEQGSPSVGGSINQTAREGGSEKVAERITLLQDAAQ